MLRQKQPPARPNLKRLRGSERPAGSSAVPPVLPTVRWSPARNKEATRRRITPSWIGAGSPRSWDTHAIGRIRPRPGASTIPNTGAGIWSISSAILRPERRRSSATNRARKSASPRPERAASARIAWTGFESIWRTKSQKKSAGNWASRRSGPSTIGIT